MDKVLLSSKSMNWCTPDDLFQELDSEFHFKLDAAANSWNAKCNRFFTPAMDALKQCWDVGGAVFCNPPYGRTLGKWVQKAYQESQRMDDPIVMLIPARTDTSYFHDYILRNAEIRFLRGRLRFTDENGEDRGRAPFPSMVVIWR